MPTTTKKITLAGPPRNPSASSLSAKSCLIRCASMPNTVWSKKLRNVASTMANSANHALPAEGQACACAGKVAAASSNAASA
jgi:hypothetical protein